MVLLARKFIDSANPLMIANKYQLVELGINEASGGGVMRRGVGGLISDIVLARPIPKWSYCRMGADGAVTEVVEKQVVSNEATVGIYNFRQGRDYVRAADAMIAANLRVNNEFYVAPTYNQLIKEGAKIITMKTGREYAGMHGVGTPEDMELFKKTAFFQKLATH